MTFLETHFEPKQPEGASERALCALASRQHGDGAWEGEVVWCTMITAQVVIARAIVGCPNETAWCAGVRSYLARQQNPDGGWGLHPLASSRLFTTTLSYVALRLLGEPPDGAMTAPALAWIHRHPEGVAAIPSWGKLWLAFLDLYPYDGITPVPPELFLLPRWAPLRPDQLYCHTRYIYLAIAVLMGRRFRADLGPLRDGLREELYGGRYAAIDFTRYRTRVAETDLYVAPSRLLRLSYRALVEAGRWRARLGFWGGLRARALARCLDLIRGEIAATAAQCLSPVNGVLNLLAVWAENPADPTVARLLRGLDAWRWQDDGAIRYAGARSQSWDTAFALQALTAASSLPTGLAETVRLGYRWLLRAQLGTSPAALNPDRQELDGGWCFSDGAHRWPVSDCTAEALSALLACHAVRGLIVPENRIAPERLAAAIRFILARQNRDGGFGTYERRRGPGFLERLNPSEMFGQCMTELSYVECTGSALAAMSHAAAAVPALAADAELSKAGPRAVEFLLRAQRPDGAWPGFWGINFLYGTCFAMRGLAAAGIGAAHPAMQRAARWIEAAQRPDGGWGEHFSGCLTRRYVASGTSLVRSTSWALLALLAILPADRPSIARGIAWLAAQQRADGSWPREPVNGVFFGSAMLEYPLYTSYFPTLALALGGTGDG